MARCHRLDLGHGEAGRAEGEAVMKTGRIAGLNKDISRLVIGCDNQREASHANCLFDDYAKRGGNCFDTSFIYGGGVPEKLLGEWIKANKLRDQVVIIGKGAHTPNCNPPSVDENVKISLERMQVDYVDLYLLHRDNLDIPVGEFVDCLNRHVKAGRFRVFGGSNWSIERVQAANEYARAKGLQGFGVVSNNFSLARMVNPVWAGCISASDPVSRAWFTREQMPLFPWSSQARGFFTDRAAPTKTDDKEMVNSWYSDDNWKRRDRVIQMADKRGVLPINIALAYVLSQPFPIFPLIGPRTIEETKTTMPGLDIQLTPSDLRFLNLEEERSSKPTVISG
jgi:aryl-alcohol dehydrogenase-like predicted oxidoreductase